MELVCPAGNLPALHAALDAGADAIYVGFRDQTNARSFPGLNFTYAEIATGIRAARERGRKIFIALNTYPETSRLSHWQRAVDRAADLGAHAIIAADMAVLDYAANRHPDLPRHLSVQGSATTAPALRYMHDRFGTVSYTHLDVYKRQLLHCVVMLCERRVRRFCFRISGHLPMRCSATGSVTIAASKPH